MSDSQDKRKFKRFLLPVAHFEEMTGTHVSGVSRVWDVSRSGFRILSPVPIKKGTLLRLRISVPNVLDLVCEGTVCWMEAAPDKMYWVGLSFAQIDPKDKIDLLNDGYDDWLREEKKKHS